MPWFRSTVLDDVVAVKLGGGLINTAGNLNSWYNPFGKAWGLARDFSLGSSVESRFLQQQQHEQGCIQKRSQRLKGGS